VIDERSGIGSGKPVCVVIFDNSPEIERTVLTEFLQESSARMPAAAKAVVKKKRVPKPKPEPVSDGLLYELKDKYLADDSESLLESGVEE
jgi:hypothetical protein